MGRDICRNIVLYNKAQAEIKLNQQLKEYN